MADIIDMDGRADLRRIRAMAPAAPLAAANDRPRSSGAKRGSAKDDAGWIDRLADWRWSRAGRACANLAALGVVLLFVGLLLTGFALVLS